MEDKDSTPTIKPLATKIERPDLPRFEELGSGKSRHTRVSHLRVNRPLYRKMTPEEEKEGPPTTVKGERAFEPSSELKQRLDRIRQIEESITQVPSPTTEEQKEEREEEIQEARLAYQGQLEKLRERERELVERLQKSEDRLTQVQAELSQEKEETKSKQEAQELLQRQQSRIRELEENQASMEDRLNGAREKWKQKVSDLKKIKGQAEEEEQPRQVEELGRQIHQYQEKIAQFKEKRNELVQKIHKEESELERLKDLVNTLTVQNKEKEELIRQQKQRVEELQRDKEKISRFANDLVKKLAQVEDLQRVEHTITVAERETEEPEYEPKVIKAVPQAKDTPPLTDKPNAISGIVLDVDGQPLENTLVIIKDESEKPQRALRTNKVGEFVVSSPLPNGTYKIVAQKEGLNFDIMEIELTGKVLEPIEIRAVS